MFGEGFARRLARRYRRRGLDPTATWMVDFLATGGVDGATVLEVGGGVGEIGIELARRGAASVLTVELSGAYDEAAARLANEACVADRMHRRLVDIAVDAAPEADAPRSVEPADVVVLHRVVCCYPDYDRLLGAAARLCRDRLVFSHPARHLGTRAVVVAENVGFALARRTFRTFVHQPAAMLGVLDDAGMRQRAHRGGTVWQAEVVAR